MTQSAQPTTVWLTKTTFDRLTAELEDLRGPQRQEVIERISAARDEGDLKENGGYHAAKDEQGKIEARIRQLEEMLRDADDRRAPTTTASSSPGKVVTYRFVGDDETEVFLLGAREIDDDHDDSRSFSPQSPLGAAMRRRHEGRDGRLRGPQRQDPEDRDRRRRPVHDASDRRSRPVTR